MASPGVLAMLLNAEETKERLEASLAESQASGESAAAESASSMLLPRTFRSSSRSPMHFLNDSPRTPILPSSLHAGRGRGPAQAGDAHGHEGRGHGWHPDGQWPARVREVEVACQGEGGGRGMRPPTSLSLPPNHLILKP